MARWPPRQTSEIEQLAMWMRLRAELRGKLRSMLLLVLAVGLAGGVTLTALAGARRTNSAVSRFLAYERPPDGSVDPVDPGHDDLDLLAKVARLPQVAATDEIAYVFLAQLDASGQPFHSGMSTFAFVDRADLSRPRVVAGRMPDPDRADEIAVNPSAAATGHLAVGSTLRFRSFQPDQALQILRGSDVSPTGPLITVQVVGIVLRPTDLSLSEAAPGTLFASQDAGYLTPGFFRSYGSQVARVGIGMGFRLKRGSADLAGFTAAAGRLIGDQYAVHAGSDDRASAEQAQRATRLEALALLLFGGLAGVVTLMMIAQALSRQMYLDAAEYPALRAVGMTRSQVVGIAALRAATVGIAGAILAATLAVALSPFMPIGVARQAEVSPGISVDLWVLGTGSLTVVVVLAGWAALAAWRAARQGLAGNPAAVSGTGQSSRLADGVARAGLTPSATIGIRMALDPGRGATTVPVRTTLLSAVIAVGVVAATLTFGTNLTRLAQRPGLQGWNWDLSVGNPHSDDVAEQAIPLLTANPSVSEFTAIAGGDGGATIQVGDQPVGIFGVTTVKGSVLPPLTAGRAPSGPDEIALGDATLRKLHKAVGDRIAAVGGGEPRTMRITGRIVLDPSVVNDAVRLGEGGIVTTEALQALGIDVATNVFLIRLAPGIDRAEALGQLRTDFPGPVLLAVRPPDVENLRRVDHLPTLLALLFAIVALLTVGHTLVSSVRRRRRELAVLRAMGFVRRQVSSAVAWQATTVVALGLLIGDPTGVGVGRVVWMAVDRALGLPPDAVIPVVVLALVVPVALAAANAVAAVPGILAGRARPAIILRTE